MQFRKDASQFTIFFAKLNPLFFCYDLFSFLAVLAHWFSSSLSKLQILVPIFIFWSFTPPAPCDLLMLFPASAAFVFCCLLHTFNQCLLVYFQANSSELFQYQCPQLNVVLYCILLAQNTAETGYGPYHFLESHPQIFHMQTVKSKFIFTLLR